MTEAEIQERIAKLEEYLATQDITFNRMLVLAGEWEGLNKVLGNTETAWSLMWRLRECKSY